MGDVYITAAITVSETHVVNWSGMTMDFYPLHIDKEYAASTQIGQRLVYGPLIFGIAAGLVSKEGFIENAVIAGSGFLTILTSTNIFLRDYCSLKYCIN